MTNSSAQFEPSLNFLQPLYSKSEKKGKYPFHIKSNLRKNYSVQKSKRNKS